MVEFLSATFSAMSNNVRRKRAILVMGLSAALAVGATGVASAESANTAKPAATTYYRFESTYKDPHYTNIRCLGTNSSKQVVMVTCSTSTSDQWSIAYPAHLKNRANGLCLQESGVFKYDRLALTLQSCSSSTVEQEWYYASKKMMSEDASWDYNAYMRVNPGNTSVFASIPGDDGGGMSGTYAWTEIAG